MATVAKLTSIGILIVSFLLAILFYYMLSSKTKEFKRKAIEQTSSMIINFVIYIWLAKIVLNLGIFVRDPLAVLAYPSDSRAFYLAFTFILLHVIYQLIKDFQQVKQTSEVYVPVFISASFFYEFIHKITGNLTFSSLYLVLLFILLLILVMWFERWPKQIFHSSLMIVWSIGTFILAMCLPIFTIFGYLMSPLFFACLLIMFVSLLIFSQRKVVR